MFVRAIVSVAAVFCSISSLQAQDRVRNLQDLVGSQRRVGDNEMRQRGFEFLRVDPSGRDEYLYFTERRSGRCVTVYVENNRYRSVVYAPDVDCDNNRGGGATSAENLQDLVGVRASSGEYQLKQRGYRLVRNETSGNARMNYWRKGSECVAVEVFDGKYSYLNRVATSDCGGGGNRGSGGGNRGAGGGNYDSANAPRVKVDTAGRGSLSGGSFNNARIDRGYVDTERQNSVGVRANGRVVTFFGNIIDSRSDREFTMNITSSSEGRANGRAEVRLNRDRNEVEMISLSGRMDGSNLNGNFTR